MDRRTFLKSSLLASSVIAFPNLIYGLDKKTLGNKKLVVLQLSGGNDGLNTVVPYSNDIYYKLRPTLAIKPTEVIQLNDELGFHPALKKLSVLFEEGEMKIFNQVGYPDQNKSHFRATDIWLTASDSDEYYSKGWLGAFVDKNGDAPHSAIEINTKLSLSLKGEKNLGMAFLNPNTLRQMGNSNFFNALAKTKVKTNEPLSFLYETFRKTKTSTQYLFDNYKQYKSHVSYPKSKLAKNLSTVAAFIGSGISTPIYYVTMGGFDTHSNQQKRQERLLRQLDGALGTFIEDLKFSKKWSETLILVFSEFGRRMNENGSKGTDHGMANNVWLLSGGLHKAGFANAASNLSLTEENDLLHKIDFREIYTSILENWFGAKKDLIKGNFKSHVI